VGFLLDQDVLAGQFGDGLKGKRELLLVPDLALLGIFID